MGLHAREALMSTPSANRPVQALCVQEHSDVADAIMDAVDAAMSEGAGDIAEKLRQILPASSLEAGSSYPQ
jgi:hypothetical protein